MSLTIVRKAFGLTGLTGLALLAEPLSGLAETAAAGYLGVSAQSSLALGSGVVTTATWLLTPLMFVQTTEVARLRRTGDETGLRLAVRRSVAMAALWGCVLACVVGVFALVLVDDGDARGFLLARAAGLPVSSIVFAMYGALRGSGWVRDVAVLALLGAAMHVGFIFCVLEAGFGIGEMGVASGVSQLVVALLGMRLLLRRGLWRFTEPAIGASVGLPGSSIRATGLLALRSTLLGSATLAMTAAAVHAGIITAAAHLVVYQVWLLTVLAVEGWKSAAQILVASSSDGDERLVVEKTMLHSAVLLGTATALVLLLVQPFVVGRLAASVKVADSVSSIWWLCALSFVVAGVAVTRDGVEFGRGAFAANVFRTGLGTVFTVVGAAITYASGELVWMWVAMTVGLLARAVLPYGRFVDVTRPPGN